MKFKEPHMEAQLKKTNTLLQHIAHDFDLYSRLLFGIESVVTRVSDPEKAETGVHTDLRAIDFRDEHGSLGKTVYLYTKEQRDCLINMINARYPRKDGYLTCYYHQASENEVHHFHCQVSAVLRNHEPPAL